MSRHVGTVSVGIRLPIIKKGSDLASIVVDELNVVWDVLLIRGSPI